jgi:hemerythrin
MINELNDAMGQGKGKAALGNILRGLIAYTRTHFGTEERYFARFGYPDTDSHKREHAAFVQRVADFRDGLEQGKLTLSIEVMKFLSNWLTKHIMGTDKKYSAFFNANGLK